MPGRACPFRLPTPEASLAVLRRSIALPRQTPMSAPHSGANMKKLTVFYFATVVMSYCMHWRLGAPNAAAVGAQNAALVPGERPVYLVGGTRAETIIALTANVAAG